MLKPQSLSCAAARRPGQLRVAVIRVGLPGGERGGGGNRISGLIHQLIERGHVVDVVCVAGKHADREFDESVVGSLAKERLSFHVVRFKEAAPRFRGFRRLAAMWTDPEAVFASSEAATRPAVIAKIREIAPDCVFAFSPDPLVYVQDVRDIPVLALLSETMHLNMATQLRYTAPRPHWSSPRQVARYLYSWLEVYARERLDARHCRTPTRLAFSAPHYLEWARAHGLDQAVLFRTSTADAGGADWREKRAAVPANPRPRILVIGHMHSTNNSAGLPMLFEEVVPALLARLGPGGFDLHIVGRHEQMPQHMRKWLDCPDAIFRGPVYPADDEFLRADVVLVTVPAATGPRTRILSAFTYGACVVAHSANALGIPELRHGVNCLLGRTGAELADCIVEAARNPELRKRLGEAGRKVYEGHYTEDYAGSELERILLETSGRLAVQDHA